MAYLQLADRLLTELAVGVDDVEVTLVVASAEGFPAATEYLLTLWDRVSYFSPNQDPNVEVVLVTNRAGTTLTVTRGQLDTSGVAHSAGTAVGLYWHAANATEMQDEIDLRLPLAGGQIGGVADYTNVAANGQLTFHGDAQVLRHVRVAAPAWRRGAVAPTEENNGVFATLNFGHASNDECYYTLLVPFRMEAGSDISIVVDWFHEEAADTGKIYLGIEHKFVAEGEAVEGGTSLTTQLSGASVINNLQHTLFATGMVGGVGEDMLGMRLYRTGGANGDTLGGFAKIIAVHFHFTMDKLGLPI